jgi:hypothetical protein
MIKEYTKLALLCPLRRKDDNLEVLLIRKAFFNPDENRPRRSAGEWVFPGALIDPKEAKREHYEFLHKPAQKYFEIETGYNDSYNKLRFIRSGVSKYLNSNYLFLFYTAEVNGSFNFKTDPKVVMDIKWDSPKNWVELLSSDDFAKSQKKEILERGLNDYKYGSFAITRRYKPRQNIVTMRFLDYYS